MSRPVVVAHVVHSLGIGGLENGVVNLVNGPCPGLRHCIVCMTGDGALRSRLPDEVEVVFLSKRAGHDLPTFSRLVRELRRLRPDIVHSRNWATFDAVIAARLAGVRATVHGEHGRDISDPDGQHPTRKRLRRWLGPLVDRFVTVSDDLRRWIVDDVRVPVRKVVTIHNGVDTGRFAPGDSGAARAALGISARARAIGTVGRLDPVKDQASLIHAFNRLRHRFADLVLVVAGDGPCRGDLEALVAALGLADHVRLLGARNDVPGVLAALDVFVLPSIAEGISNTILEAMATGLPVVATRVGGNPELIEDGVTGLLVPAREPTALSAAVGAYLDDSSLRATHGGAGRQRATTHFSLDGMRAAYARVYVSVSPAARRSQWMTLCAE